MTAVTEARQSTPSSPPATSAAPGPHVWRSVWLSGFGLALGLLGAFLTDPADIDGRGLLPALHPLYFAGVALVLTGAVLDLTSTTRRNVWFALHVVALALLLHGIAGIVEPNPRFPTAYLHVGFADQIATHGSLLQGLDARFNWAGFFSGAALVQAATGGGPLTWALRFFPVLVDLLLALLIDVLGKTAHVPSHRRRAAVLFFLVCNWIGQDYFSPQATASVLYLVTVLMVVTLFPGSGTPARLARWLRPELHRSPPAVPMRSQLTAMAGLLLLVAALVTGHQITPGFLALATLLLAVTGLSRLYAFPVLVGVTTIGWLSFAAEPYWSGHLQKLTGSAGRVSTLVNDNVTKRAVSGTAARDLVVHDRLAFSLLLMAAMVVSIAVLHRRRRLPLLLACLALAPWPMLLVQAYGGEMALRVLLFSLPGTCLLVATVLLPARARTRWYHKAVVLVLLVALLPAFLLARYGNELYEQVTSDDIAVLGHVYEDRAATVLVITANSKTPRYFERVDRVRFASLDSRLPQDVVEETTSRPGYDQRFIFVSATQDALGVQTQGERPGWTQRLAVSLVASGRFEVAAEQGKSVLLRLLPAPGASTDGSGKG